MTINIADNAPRISYSVAEGVTQTSFAVPFEFFNASDIKLYVDTTLKTLVTNYTVSGGSGSTGTVTSSVTGIAGGSVVVITRDIALERTSDFPVAGSFNITSLNTELDRFVAIAADLKDNADRSLSAEDYDASVSLTIPTVVNRKGKTLAFNLTTGAVEAGPTIADTQSVADASADIALLADIQDGTVATNAITNVNTIRTDVSTVSGISGNVTTVAGNNANVSTVAGNIADVNTVAGIDSNVTTVAGISANVTAVAGNATNINTVAADGTDIGIVSTNIANVNTVAGINANVSTVAGISANVTAVADDAADIGTVSTNIASVNTVATNIASVNTAASDIASIINVANDLNEAVSEIDTVANNIASVQTVGDNIANVNTVAGISANVSTVAGISANVTSVAGNATNINLVAGDATDIGIVAGLDTEIGTLAGLNTEIIAIYADLPALSTKVVKTSDTGAAVLPAGTTGQRDGAPTAGYIRYNTSTNSFEGYGASWMPVGGGATGGGNDAIFVENDLVVTTNYTIPATKNAHTVGPISINSGISVTVSSGSRWLVS